MVVRPMGTKQSCVLKPNKVGSGTRNDLGILYSLDLNPDDNAVQQFPIQDRRFQLVNWDISTCRVYWLRLWGRRIFLPLNPVAWIGIIIVAGLIVYAIIKGKHLFWLPVVILVVVVVVSIGVNLVGHITVSYWQNLPNRTFFIYPLFVIILAYGIIKLKDKWMWGILSILLVVYSVGICNYFSEREVIKPILTVPWREIMSNIRDQSNPNAVVICTNEDFACSYYQEQYGYKAFSRRTGNNFQFKNHLRSGGSNPI